MLTHRLSLAIGFVFTVTGLAQTPNSPACRGQVKDQSSTPIVDATVRLVPFAADQTSLTFNTDSRGFWSCSPSIPSGRYLAAAIAPGRVLSQSYVLVISPGSVISEPQVASDRIDFVLIEEPVKATVPPACWDTATVEISIRSRKYSGQNWDADLGNLLQPDPKVILTPMPMEKNPCSNGSSTFQPVILPRNRVDRCPMSENYAGAGWSCLDTLNLRFESVLLPRLPLHVFIMDVDVLVHDLVFEHQARLHSRNFTLVDSGSHRATQSSCAYAGETMDCSLTASGVEMARMRVIPQASIPDPTSAPDSSTTPPPGSTDPWYLRDRLAALRQRLATMPPPKSSWQELLSMQANGRADEYFEIYLLAVDRNGLATNAGIAARRFLERGDYQSSAKFYRQALLFEVDSGKLFSAAEDANLGSLDKAYSVVEVVYNSSKYSSQVIAAAACAEFCRSVVDVVFLATDYAVDYTAAGEEEATKNLLRDIIVDEFMKRSGAESLVRQSTKQSGFYKQLLEVAGDGPFREAVGRSAEKAGGIVSKGMLDSIVAGLSEAIAEFGQ